MFNKDYFREEDTPAGNRTRGAAGSIGAWGLHLAAVAFLIYSGYHGIHATTAFRGESQLAAAAGIAGIVVIELVLFSLYLAWHNHRITGSMQSIAAATTYLFGFTLACLGIVADSQLQAGYALAGWLRAYLYWGLPIAPAVMSLGALLTHELAPEQLRARRQAAEREAFAEEQFTAHINAQRAEMESAKVVRNMQLNARAETARQIAGWYGSTAAQDAIAKTALQNAPALLQSMGISIEYPGATGEPAQSESRPKTRPLEPVATVSRNGHTDPGFLAGTDKPVNR